MSDDDGNFMLQRLTDLLKRFQGDIKSANGETLFDKAHFVSDVQKCLLSGEADIAVHSAKDTPAGETAGLLRHFLPSQSNEDVLIFREEDKFLSLIHI